jgi:hypothetical protein
VFVVSGLLSGNVSVLSGKNGVWHEAHPTPPRVIERLRRIYQGQ